MQKVEFKCRVITPIFMTGAGNRPELRPSALKGMMRFWWRAAKAEDDIKKLREEEAKIFGGTGEGEGKSKVWIRVKYDEKRLKSYMGKHLKSVYNLEWTYDRRSNSLEGKHNGIGYILYSTVLPNREREFIRDGFTFDITFRSFDEDTLKQVLASFWLSVYLGGFGTRARRGGGNIVISEIKGESTAPLSFIPDCNSSSELAIWIQENFRKASSIINDGKENYDLCTSYSNLSLSRFVIAKEGESSTLDALNKIGEIFHEFRKRNKARLPEVGVFGLPVIVRGRKKVIGLSPKGSNRSYNRRGSPIIFKVLYSNNKYYWFVLRFTGEFLPEGSILKFEDKTQKPDYGIIDDFWMELKRSGNEYILNTPEKLNKVVEKIKKQLNPDKVILFGSRARGDAHKRSDIDIAVDTHRNIQQIDLYGNFDIVRLKDANQKLKDRIEREGVILYERKTKVNS